MLSKLKSTLTQSLTKKQLNCPNCNQRIAVPIKMGKTLRITCTSCRSQFDISFKMPTFNSIKQLSSSFNAKSFYQRYKLIVWVSIGLMVLNIATKLFLPTKSPVNDRYDKPIQNEIYDNEKHNEFLEPNFNLEI